MSIKSPTDYLPDFSEPGRITLNEYVERRMHFERYARRETNPEGTVGTLLCLEEVIDESTGQKFPTAIVESHNPDTSFHIMRSDRPMQIQKEHTAAEMIYPFYLFVNTITRKGMRILIATDETEVALDVHEYLAAMLQKVSVMHECLQHLLQQSVYHPILVVEDEGSLVRPRGFFSR